MDENLNSDDFKQWFSTYGLITSQRILGHYQIVLPAHALIPAIKNQQSFYHLLVQVPLKNVLNGIILQQANDYHVYAQKIFIDYLLSGESAKPPEAQGASTRERLEEERQALIELGDEFNKKQLEHEALISLTQNSFIKLTRELKEHMDSAVSLTYSIVHQEGLDVSKNLVKEALIHGLIYCGINSSQNEVEQLKFIETIASVAKINPSAELKAQMIVQLADMFDMMLNTQQQINVFLDTVLDMNAAARLYRKQFYDSVLRVVELINMLPEYRMNQEQDIINKETLYFDKSIGEV